jgi:hypothetical protein
VVIESPEQHAAWVARNSPIAVAAVDVAAPVQE